MYFNWVFLSQWPSKLLREVFVKLFVEVITDEVSINLNTNTTHLNVRDFAISVERPIELNLSQYYLHSESNPTELSTEDNLKDLIDVIR